MVSFVESATLSGDSAPASMIIATIHGQALTHLPKDLYIPPDALRILLETFEGPLDILLYLIKKQNLDILDIPIAEITRQYLCYINLMQGLALELAADYLVMAAMLAEIKSRLLLPRHSTEKEEIEADPRAELARRLEIYAQFKEAAIQLNALARTGRDIFTVQVNSDSLNIMKPKPLLTLAELAQAFARVTERQALQAHHTIMADLLSVEEKMTMMIASIVSEQKRLKFNELLIHHEGRLGIVVTFLAMLELLKQQVIDCIQKEAFACIDLHPI